jgi:hypothetical protein
VHQRICRVLPKNLLSGKTSENTAMNDIHSIPQARPAFQAPSSLTDPIHTILEVSLPAIQDLVRDFRRGPSPESFLRLEEALQKELADTGAVILATVVGSLQRDREFVAGSVAAARATADRKLRNHGLRTTTIRFLGGAEIPITTPYLSRDLAGRSGRRRGVGRRGESGEGCYPFLEALGIQHQVTPALASEVARQCVRCGSFEEASEALRERGIAMDPKGARTLTLFVGEEALRQREARKQAAAAGSVFSEEFVGKRIVVSTDGGRLRTREGGKRGRRGKKGRRRFRTPWREPKLVIAYVIDENGRKLRSSRPLYDGTLEDAGTAFEGEGDRPDRRRRALDLEPRGRARPSSRPPSRQHRPGGGLLPRGRALDRDRGSPGELGGAGQEDLGAHHATTSEAREDRPGHQGVPAPLSWTERRIDRQGGGVLRSAARVHVVSHAR